MKLYIDLTQEKTCAGVILASGVEPVYVGTEIHVEPAKYRDLAKPFAENDFHFWFSDEKPEISRYTVPKTQICGYDSRGGYFAAPDHLTFHEAHPMYYIDPELRCWLITGDARKFREPFPNWREGMILCDAIDVFPSREAAQKKYDIKTLQDLWDSQI